MRCSTIFALLSLTAVTQAAALEVRNANHVSKYTSDACNNDDKYAKWKSALSCICVKIGSEAASIYTDHEPLQHVIAFSDGNCKNELGRLHAKKCVKTADRFDAGAIGSVMFWVPGGCNLLDGLEGIKAGIDDIFLTAAELIA